MGIRFRKSIRLAPGVRFNLGRHGSSLSIGGHGVTENISRRGLRSTVGLSGTGLSYTAGGRRRARSKPGLGGAIIGLVAIVLVFAWLFG